MIHVLATVEVAPGRREDFLREFRKVVSDVRREKGCIDYGPAVDIATGIPVQIPLRDNVVVIVERWENLDALKAHLVAPHMKTYRAAVKDLVKGMQVQVLQPV
ncbi:MAG TPA: putative quinol monooxygenase [Syntrophales bacterium]|nr:putative quinol monooxygenase [Syntrophales bacterium]HOX93476.1 putative quinol monooxygenase [Syntrophales bacterium]HPI57554.1 putative quinol monooxygenase [Syntrophales bacterium]HPN24711.1 putative quinol monooxygenase [Syntrophales bacterium]HQM29842.1 putative quinol monooxygenase [Syntrophales bacterium]